MKSIKGACGVLLLAGAALLTGCDNKEPSGPPDIVIEKKAVVLQILPDCEDTLKVPCVTFDEGAWRKITDYSPYKSKVIKKPARFGPWFILR